MIKIEIKDSVKIIENRNKIHYFVSGIVISTYRVYAMMRKSELHV